MSKKETFYFYLLLVIMSLVPAAVPGQVHFGIKAGMNMGDIKVRSETLLVDEQYAPLRVWHFGMNGTFDLSKNISFQSDLLFNQKGGQSPVDLNMPNPREAYWQYKLTYLSLPMLMQYNFGPMALEAGPEIGYLIHMKVRRNDMLVENDLSFLGDQKIDFSMCVGFKFSVEQFFTEIRWVRSFLSMGDVTFSDMNGTPLGYYHHYANTLQVSFGYYFFGNEKAEKITGME